MDSPRQFHRCAYDSNTALIYVVGGVLSGGVLTSVSIYDINSDQWSVGTAMPATRSYFQLGLTSTGLYLLGGADVNGQPSTSVYKYDATGDAWSTEAGLSLAQAYAGMDCLCLDHHVTDLPN